ncbi:MAG: amidohydrolase family protein [Candidatus Hodarchaeales archaeon]|jgi:predicted TIM-barrel fold metal-dependent hydrolase
MSNDNKEKRNKNTVIDCHHHFITQESIAAFRRMIPKEEFKKMEIDPEMQKFVANLPTAEQRAQLTIEEMKKYNINQILLMSFSGDFNASYSAHKLFPNEFPALVPMIDPRYDTPDIIEEYKQKGAVSIKFHPGTWGYDFGFDDDRILPYLEACLEFDLVPMIHFGVLKGANNPTANWPANPLELRPWLQHPKFQEQKYIISHFGAGFLREIFLLAYANKKRIFVDTSGSNDWIQWSPWQDLRQVFEKSVLALSPQNILFGTDSGRTPLRHDVSLRQIGLLEDLVTKKVISDQDRWDILGNNTKRILLAH